MERSRLLAHRCLASMGSVFVDDYVHQFLSLGSISISTVKLARLASQSVTFTPPPFWDCSSLLIQPASPSTHPSIHPPMRSAPPLLNTRPGERVAFVPLL